MIYKTFSKATKIFLAIALLGFSSFSWAMEKGEELESYTTGSSLLEQSLENLIKNSLVLFIKKIVSDQKVDPQEAASFAVLPLEVIDYMLDFVEVPSKEFHFLKMYLQKHDSGLPKHIIQKLVMKVFFKLLFSIEFTKELKFECIVDKCKFLKSYLGPNSYEAFIATIQVLHNKLDQTYDNLSFQKWGSQVNVDQLIESYIRQRNLNYNLDLNEIYSTEISKNRRKYDAYYPLFYYAIAMGRALLLFKYSKDHLAFNTAAHPTLDLLVNILWSDSIGYVSLAWGSQMAFGKLINLIERKIHKNNIKKYSARQLNYSDIREIISGLSRKEIQEFLTLISDNEDSGDKEDDSDLEELS